MSLQSLFCHLFLALLSGLGWASTVNETVLVTFRRAQLCFFSCRPKGDNVDVKALGGDEEGGK